jgi:GNAT superfamily N-acetyltransferase
MTSVTTNAPHAIGWTVAPHPVSAPESDTLLRRYYAELITRYYGRPTDDDEISFEMARAPSDDLTRPTGEFVVARRDGVPAGCVGLRVLDPTTTELTRLYVGPEARGQGVATLLIDAVERLAMSDFGALVMRLDTRKDLLEARALYPKLGYTEIDRYNDDDLADHWFEKQLR